MDLLQVEVEVYCLILAFQGCNKEKKEILKLFENNQKMNARKAATTVPATISRLLKSDAFLKTPPPAYYPLLSHPPAPSLVRFLPPRPDNDLPPSIQFKKSEYQIIKTKFDNGDKLTAAEDGILVSMNALGPTRLTRRRPPRNPKFDKPLPIIFPEDRIRRQFFRDHPFEAYRPVFLAEGQVIIEAEGPQGIQWTSLRQRSSIPTAEDAISFTINLNQFHNISLTQAYSTSIAQFRTLRAENEISNRAARLEATSHGAIFFGEIQKGLLIEEKVLDEWINARSIESQIQAKLVERGGGGSIISSSGNSSSSGSPTFWSELNGKSTVEEVVSQDGEEFTGGVDYIQRFEQRGNSESS